MHEGLSQYPKQPSHCEPLHHLVDPWGKGALWVLAFGFLLLHLIRKVNDA